MLKNHLFGLTITFFLINQTALALEKDCLFDETLETNISQIQKSSPLAYVVNNNNNTISLCPVNPDGSLATCTSAVDPSSSLNSPANIIINAAGTLAFITNYTSPGTIVICRVNPDGSLGSRCIVTDGGGPDIFDQPNAITLNSAGTVLYVANGGDSTPGSVTVCRLDACGLSSCTRQGGIGPDDSNGTNGVTLNPANTLAYITTYYKPTNTTEAKIVTICPVISLTGLLDVGGCYSADGNGTLPTTMVGPIDIKINASNTYAYISDNQASGPDNNALTICAIDPTNNYELINCADQAVSPATLDGAAGIFLSSDNLYIYIASYNNLSWITQCDLISGGAQVDNCVYFFDPSFNGANDIIIN